MAEGDQAPDGAAPVQGPGYPASPPAPHDVGPGPYRAPPPPLRLPRSYRRLKLALIVLASAAAGALLHAYVPAAVHLLAAHPHVAAGAGAPLAPVTESRIGPVTLVGPHGSVALPMEDPVIVNIWLQACADCMPAFEAFHAHERSGAIRALEAPVVNVAFGSADHDWAARYGVAENLVIDPSGAAVVRTLGIGTFTTLVLDERGYVRHVDRPDRPGYVDRLSGALRALASAPAGSPHRRAY